jgi:hypothetical protein
MFLRDVLAAASRICGVAGFVELLEMCESVGDVVFFDAAIWSFESENGSGGEFYASFSSPILQSLQLRRVFS